MRNILLVIVDCLRYDRVTETRMPLLYGWGRANVWHSNYWSSGHCTDPVVTHMLSGLHPDELQLYSMMFEHKEYTIPENIEMLPQFAMKNGYITGFITNIGRWYKRGVMDFVDCRQWPGERIFGAAREFVKTANEPWFLIVHTDDCHTNYTGGTYDAACKAVDVYIQGLFQDVPAGTSIIVTADHGEGLGDKGIVQHGFGLWDFLTHVPLLTNFGLIGGDDRLCEPGYIYQSIKDTILDKQIDYTWPTYVFQAGDTPPNIRHRGVVSGAGNQYIVEIKGDVTTETTVFNTVGLSNDLKGKAESAFKNEMRKQLSHHLALCGLDDSGPDEKVIERLRALGYFG